MGDIDLNLGIAPPCSSEDQKDNLNGCAPNFIGFKNSDSERRCGVMVRPFSGTFNSYF